MKHPPRLGPHHKYYSSRPKFRSLAGDIAPLNTEPAVLFIRRSPS